DRNASASTRAGFRGVGRARPNGRWPTLRRSRCHAGSLVPASKRPERAQYRVRPRVSPPPRLCWRGRPPGHSSAERSTRLVDVAAVPAFPCRISKVASLALPSTLRESVIPVLEVLSQSTNLLRNARHSSITPALLLRIVLENQTSGIANT